MSVNHKVDITRISTGLIMAAVIVAALYFRGLPLLFLILLACALALWEFFSMFWGPNGRIAGRCCGILLGWGMLILTWMNRPRTPWSALVQALSWQP